MRVDLPAPLAPTRPTIPGSSSTLSWSSAVTAAYRLRQPLDRDHHAPELDGHPQVRVRRSAHDAAGLRPDHGDPADRVRHRWAGPASGPAGRPAFHDWDTAHIQRRLAEIDAQAGASREVRHERAPALARAVSPGAGPRHREPVTDTHPAWKPTSCWPTPPSAAPEGKVHALGLGWTVTVTPLPAQAVVVFIKVPWDLANQSHRAVLTLIDEDGRAVSSRGPEGGQVRIESEFETGRPAGVPPRDAARRRALPSTIAPGDGPCRRAATSGGWRSTARARTPGGRRSRSARRLTSVICR